jgi:hypothetical protein
LLFAATAITSITRHILRFPFNIPLGLLTVELAPQADQTSGLSQLDFRVAENPLLLMKCLFGCGRALGPPVLSNPNFFSVTQH